MSTIDQVKIRESRPAKDRRSNHWATPPTLADRTRTGSESRQNASEVAFLPAQWPNRRQVWRRNTDRWSCETENRAGWRWCRESFQSPWMASLPPELFDYRSTANTRIIIIIKTEFAKRLLHRKLSEPIRKYVIN